MDNTIDFTNLTARARGALKAWSRLPVRRRLRYVKAFRRRLAEGWRTLAEAVAAEVGRPVPQVLPTEILPTASACRFLEKNASRILKSKKIPRSKRPLWLLGERDTVHRRPRGVVGIIGTWNYPVYLNAVQILQALAAGNAVVWKPSEVTPRVADRLAALFREIGLPEGLLTVLPPRRELGAALAEADVDHVVFTGSEKVGRKLAARLGERLVSSTMELSGCDALFVMADADPVLAAKAAWFGVTLNHGQTCIAVRRIFVNRRIQGEFLDRLRPLMEATPPVRLVMDSQREQAERLIGEAIDGGARRLLEDAGDGFRPTVLLDATPGMALCREASFGPVAAVIPFDGPEEALRMDGECPFGLAASVFSRNEHSAAEFGRRLNVGMVCVNDVIAPTAHPATPFGGYRDSGWGVTQGEEGLLEMTVPQVESVRSGSFRPHLEPATRDDPNMAEFLEGMLRYSHGGGLRNKLGGLWQQIRGGRKIGSRVSESGPSEARGPRPDPLTTPVRG